MQPRRPQDIPDWLESHRERFIAMADSIWSHPEVAWQEFHSSKLQADFLEAEGFRIRWDLGAINTAFVAEWGAGRPIIGLLGEYDALAGLSQKRQPTKEPVQEGAPGHGCGHNLLGTGGLASAVALRHWLEASGTPGVVRYYGCPAEEQISGKTFMAREGAFEDLDAAFNFHPDRVNAPSTGSAVGVYDMVFTFHGRTAHAGGAPHQGRSALDGVELMNVGVNYLREHVTEKVRIHYVVTDGGRLPNVVPDRAEVWYFVRAHQREELDEVAGRVRKIADGAALMTETVVEHRLRGACSSVLNNHLLADLQYQAMEAIGPINFTDEEVEYARAINACFPAENAARVFDKMKPPAEQRARLKELADRPLLGENFPAWDEDHVGTGSTDVGDVSWITPLSMLRTACQATGAPGHSWAVTATGATGIGHKGMMHAAKVMALAAGRLYQDAGLLARVREEFAESTRERPYRCPLPPGVTPPSYPNPLRG